MSEDGSDPLQSMLSLSNGIVALNRWNQTMIYISAQIGGG